MNRVRSLGALLLALSALLLLIAATPAKTVKYVAISPAVYVPKKTIDHWIGSHPIKQKMINAHAWQLWAGMTAPSGQTLGGTPLPLWETWYDSTEVYKAGPGSGPTPDEELAGASATASQAARSALVGKLHHLTKRANIKRRFQLPDQQVEKGQLSALVLSFNRFTREIRDHVWKNAYYDSDHLTKINADWSPATPIGQREIQVFPGTSIMLKPVFWLASGTEPTMVPYWAGLSEATTVNMTNPTPDTWEQCVLADPTGKAKNDIDRICNKGNAGQITMKAGRYQVVPISVTPSKSAFYALKLTEDEVDDLHDFADELGGDNNVSQGLKNVKVGDFALFVASHVSSREITNWTWQTFWWSPNPAAIPNEPPNATAPPKAIKRPWNHYNACTAYYMVVPPNDPKGKEFRCYNPYLETALTGLDSKDKSVTDLPGTTSNCMTCHRASAWTTNDYATDFELRKDNATWFTGNTKLDFLWSIQNFAHKAPFTAP